METQCSVEEFTRFLEWQNAPVVGQGMDDDDRIRARFDDLVQVADRANPRGLREGTVEPNRIAATNQITSGEITCRKIVVTGHGHERPSQTPGHVLHESGLATASGAFEHDGKPSCVAHLEDGNFVGRGEIKRRFGSRIAKTVVPACIRQIAKRGLRRGVVIGHAGVGAACTTASL